MEEQTDVIQQDMEETREDLGEKVQALQEKIAEDISAAGEAVSDTVKTVSEGVQNTLSAVHNALDVPSQVRNHPWLMLCGAVLVGYLAHELLMPSRPPEYEEEQGPPPEKPRRASAGMFSRMFGKGWVNLQRVAAETALDLAERGAREFLPGELGSSVGQTLDEMKSELRTTGQNAEY